MVTREAQLEGLLKDLRRVMLRELRIGTESPFWSRSSDAPGDSALRASLALQRTLALRCLTLFKMLVSFGYLPDRASVLEYFRRFEIEVMGLIDSGLLTAVVKPAEKTGRFEKVFVVDDTKEWNRHARVVFDIMHLLHKNNMNALVSDILRFYGRRMKDIDTSLKVTTERNIFDVALSTVKNVGAISIHGSKRACLCIKKHNAVVPVAAASDVPVVAVAPDAAGTGTGTIAAAKPLARGESSKTKSLARGESAKAKPAALADTANAAKRLMQSAFDLDSGRQITVDDWLEDLKSELHPVLASASLTAESSARLLRTTGLGDRTLVSGVLQVILDQHNEFNHLASCLRKVKLVAAGVATAPVRYAALPLI